MHTKNEIRNFVKSILKKMSPIQRKLESERLLQRLESHPLFLKARVVMMYCSLPDEVNTHDFLGVWGQKKIVLLPVVNGNNLLLRHFVSWDSMESTTFNISAPKGEVFTDYSLIDLIVVPGVAFTLDGSRLGRGGGYYDRFLSRSDLKHVPKIGLCYPCQILDNLPVELHDISMDFVIGS